MNSIVLIIPYLGKWPVWFEAHLISISKNPTINWLFITDCNIPNEYPENIRFVPTTLEDLNANINSVLGVEVPLSARKLCDIRPAYGVIFQEYISEFDFWGFCDVDIVWGNIRKFVTQDILSNHHIISSRKEAISGHFTLFRNVEKINNLYKQIPQYQFLIEQPKFMWIDEQVLTTFLKDNSDLSIHVYWKQYFVNNVNGKAHQEYYLDRWLWKDGKVLNTKTHQEVMYLHFINWKRTMKHSEVMYHDQPNSFYISYSKMHYNTHNTLQKLWNSFTNLFDGYHVRLKKNRIKKKYKI